MFIEDCRIIKGNTLICKIITQKINLIQNYPLPFLQDDGYFKWRACLTPLNRIPRMEKDFNFLHSSLSLILVLEQGDYLKTISSSILVNDSILLNIIHCHFAASTFSSSEPRIYYQYSLIQTSVRHSTGREVSVIICDVG